MSSEREDVIIILETTLETLKERKISCCKQAVADFAEKVIKWAQNRIDMSSSMIESESPRNEYWRDRKQTFEDFIRIIDQLKGKATDE